MLTSFHHTLITYYFVTYQLLHNKLAYNLLIYRNTHMYLFNIIIYCIQYSIICISTSFRNI